MGKSKVTLVKHTFFNPQLKEVNKVAFKEQDFHLSQLQAEFATLYQIFLSNNKEHSERNLKIALFVSNICALMMSYYQTDYVSSEFKRLVKQKKELSDFISACQHKIDPENEKDTIRQFPNFVLDKIRKNIKRYKSLTLDCSLTELRNDVGLINTNRSRFGYSRALATQVLNYIESSPLSDFIQELNAILGNQSSFVDGILILNESREILAIVGIALFSARFMLNLILLMKHVIEATMNEELSASKVLQQELEKRGFIMVSDLVWAVVSLLTNYSEVFQISSSAVSAMTLGFLMFDALWLLGQWYFELVKYNQNIQELQTQLTESTDFEKEIVQRQINILNDEWEVQCHYYMINILGACILATSFAISIIYTGPLALAGIALCSMLGNALYNTSSEYKQYQKSRLAVNRELANGCLLNDEHHQMLLQLLQKERDENYAQFWKSLGFNVGGVAFIITAAVVCWPVALALTISFIGYQLHGTYQQHLEDHNQVQIAHDVYRLFSPAPVAMPEQSEDMLLFPAPI